MITAKQIPTDRQSNFTMRDDYNGTCLENMNVKYDRRWEHESSDLKKLRNILRGYEYIDELVEDDYIEIQHDLKPDAEFPVEVIKLDVDHYFNGNNDDRLAAIANMLSIMTEKEYKVKEIRGSVQGEYAWVIYRKEEFDDDAIANFEIEYFNMGSEWIIEDEDGEDDFIYTHSWDGDDIRKEIADYADVDPGDVVLEVFIGYRQIPVYERR